MAVRKLSVALDEDVAEAAARDAADRGTSLSAWLTDAARARLVVAEGQRAMADWETEHGAFGADELTAAEEWLDGVLGRGRQR